MRYNPKLRQDVASYFDHVIIVEGKKDVIALEGLGFKKVYAVHQTSVPIRQRLEEIASEIGRRERVCVLTDFDKKGKTLYLTIKPILQELGVKLDSTLRGILLKAGISHIEGLYSFFQKVGKI